MPQATEEKSWQEEIREAKVYYTAHQEAVEAGQTILMIPGHYGEVEEGRVTNAERWEIYDRFAAGHEHDEDTKVNPAPALRRPPEGSPFRATQDTTLGDAAKTGERLMTEKFGPRPSNT
jgi:hypothetical protein